MDILIDAAIWLAKGDPASLPGLAGLLHFGFIAIYGYIDWCCNLIGQGWLSQPALAGWSPAIWLAKAGPLLGINIL